MKAKHEQVWIHTGGETPAIGSGRRLVEAEVGWKWVELSTGRKREKILRSVYDRLPKEPIEAENTQ